MQICPPDDDPDDESDEDEEDEGEMIGDNCMKCMACSVSFRRTFFVVVFAILYCFTVLVMLKYEGWGFLTSAYVTTQIVTTIGYGDLTPSYNATRLIMTGFVLFIVVFAASLLNDFGDRLVNVDQNHVRIGLVHLLAEKRNGLRYYPPHSVIRRLRIPALLTSMGLFFGFILFGTIFYATYEKCSCSYGITKRKYYSNCTEDTACSAGSTKSWLEAFYMSMITLTTVGFGDFCPVSKLGRAIGIPWMFFGVLAGANMVSHLMVTIQHLGNEPKSHREVREEVLKEIKAKSRKGLDKSEFVVYMLFQRGYINLKDIASYHQIFDTADHTKDGKITARDIQAAIGQDEE